MVGDVISGFKSFVVKFMVRMSMVCTKLFKLDVIFPHRILLHPL